MERGWWTLRTGNNQRLHWSAHFFVAASGTRHCTIKVQLTPFLGGALNCTRPSKPPMSIVSKKKVFDYFLDFLFPPTCVSCRSEGSWVCTACLGSLERHANDRCPFCKKSSIRGFLCLWCREQYALSQVIAAVAYDEHVRRIIHAIKFGYVSLCVPLLAPFLHDAWRIYGGEGSPVVVPIPLHAWRMRERGFNQAAFFAKEFARLADFEYRDNVLVRTRTTHAQAELPREDRLRNVEGAFACEGPGDILNANILLVDDVFTSGSTLNEAARTLRKAGARDVHALTFAHG